MTKRLRCLKGFRVKADIDFEGLREDEIESWQHSGLSKIYPLLRGGLFHRTSIEGYRGIRRSGQISPNRGQFPFTYPQSQAYYCFSKRYVCLFDFRSISDQKCISIQHIWGQFFFDQKPFTIVFRLNRDSLSEKLIPSTAVKQTDPDYKPRIAYIEAWYPEPIPFEAIDGFLVIKDMGLGKDPICVEFAQEEVHRLDELIDEIE